MPLSRARNLFGHDTRTRVTDLRAPMSPGHHAMDMKSPGASGQNSADASFVRLEKTDGAETPGPGPVTDSTGSRSIRDLHQTLMESHPLTPAPRWNLPRVKTHAQGNATGAPPSPPENNNFNNSVSQAKTFNALLRKNWRLKTRGVAAWCLLLELFVPVAFIVLMCLPRLLVSDSNSPAIFHRVAPIESLAWSRKPPTSRAVRVIYSPNTPTIRAVAEAAAVTLVCGTDITDDINGAVEGAVNVSGENNPTSPPSFQQQAAAAAALDLDLNALLGGASGSGGLGSMGPNPSGTGGSGMAVDPSLLEACLDDPMTCASAVNSIITFRENPPIPLNSALMAAPEVLRSTFCVASCVDDDDCRRNVLSEFLVGVETAELAEAMALGSRNSALGMDAGSNAEATYNFNNVSYQPAMAVVTLPTNLKPSDLNVEYTIRVNASDTPTGSLGPKWFDEKFVRWVVGEDDAWRSYWTYVNIQRAFDQALLSLSMMDDSEFSVEDLDSDTDSRQSPSSQATYPLPRGVRLEIDVKSYPFPSYSTNLGSTYAAVFFGLAFVFAFVVAVASVCQNVVTEKELRLREGMRVMGMGDAAYWGSWFVTSYSSLLLISFLVSVVGSYPFQFSDWSVTFVFLAVWSAQLVAFCFFLSTLFKDGKIASVVGSLCYILTWTPGVAVVSAMPEGSTVWLLSTFLMPASGVYMWGWAVAILENAQAGVTWSNLWTNLLAGDEAGQDASGVFSAGGVLVIALANAAMYAVLALALDTGVLSKVKTWLVEKVNQFKDSKDVRVFTLTKKSESQKVTRDVRAGEWDVAALDGGVEGSGSSGSNDSRKSTTTPAIPAIRVSGISKRFGTTQALDGMSFAARRGEITALLGHNGAGKTSTFSVLTGSLTQDSGVAWIDGVDVAIDNKSQVAQIGVCPQFDVLWPSLTVKEHLELFVSFRPLRGVDSVDNPNNSSDDSDLVSNEIEEKLKAVGLWDDRDRPAGTLSGGQKRKLSLAIAFIGNPTVVLLDEPTAGMDPLSRRDAWRVIKGLTGRSGDETHKSHTSTTETAETATPTPQESKPPISVLLTTHFMDEADALSDRVCVVHSGRLACAGSPLFVKSKFGGGYLLRVKTSVGSQDEGQDSADSSTCTPQQQILDIVTATIDGASLASIETPPRGSSDQKTQTSKILSFSLPVSETQSFPKVLRVLESDFGKELGVVECSVGCATLEDAFLNVAEMVDGGDKGGVGDKGGDTKEDGDTDATTASPSFSPEGNYETVAGCENVSERLTGVPLFLAHVRSTFWKRAVHCKRELFTVSLGLVLAPLLFVIAGLAASSVARENAGDPLPAAMTDWKFLGDVPIGVGSSAGRAVFVSSSVLSPPSEPWDVVTLGGDALEVLAGDVSVRDALEGNGNSQKPRVLPFPGVDTLWDCSNDSTVLDTCVNNCAECGPFETVNVGSSLETSLRGKLYSTADAVATPNASWDSTVRHQSRDSPVFSNFASLDGALLAAVKPRSTCRVGVSVGRNNMATCASLFVEPGGLDTQRPRPRNAPKQFKYAVATSSTAYHALPTTMALTHDAIWKATHVVGETVGETGDSVGDSGTTVSATSSPPPIASLRSINHPLPSTVSEKQEREVLSRLLISLCVVIGLGALSSSSATPFLVREKQSGAKHLQITSGLRLDSYWLGTFLWDIVQQTPTLGLVVLAFSVFNDGVDIAGNAWISLTAALFLFLLSSTPLSYLVSFLFTSPAAAVAGSLGGYVFFGVAQLIGGVTLGGLAEGGVTSGGAYGAWSVLKLLFLWLPHYCVGRVVFDLSGGFGEADDWAQEEGVGVSGDKQKQPYMPSTTRDALIALAVTSVIYASLVLLVERVGLVSVLSRFLRKKSPSDDTSKSAYTSSEDPEAGLGKGAPASPVCDEGNKLGSVHQNNQGLSTQEVLRVNGLRKKYGSTIKNARLFAVDDVSFSVAAGESFALLGVNGAGKTTTFEMLTGAIEATEGDAIVRRGRFDSETDQEKDAVNSFLNSNCVSLTRDGDAFRRAVGYCPQRDALLGNLTGWEHLLLYGSLRGLNFKDAALSAKSLASAVGLNSQTASRPAKEYSGGAKRKLAVAISLVGDPLAVLLDEPSTGMDPRSRRKLWQALQTVSKEKNVATVLTSHSMEEAEALCGKVGLMRSGVLSRVASAEVWRSALGSGHTLEVKIADDCTCDALKAFVKNVLTVSPDVTVSSSTKSNGAKGKSPIREVNKSETSSQLSRKQRACVLKFKLPLSVSTGFIFEQLEMYRTELGIETYQLGRTTLEETFLAFAGAEDEGKE